MLFAAPLPTITQLGADGVLLLGRRGHLLGW
jgi:hypothetical protein